MAGRPELDAALVGLAPGDELVVAEWDRVTRSMWDGLEIIKTVIEAGATSACLTAARKPRSAEALWLSFPPWPRTSATGSSSARMKGVKFPKLAAGRKEKLNEKQKAEAPKRLAAGEIPADLAPFYGVSRATIARLR
jgi:DNA invertase Pin-like site-specific DNA recombinase